MSDHPNRLLLDRLSVDDLPTALRESTQAHVNGCAACTAYLRELAAEKAPPVAGVMRAIAARRKVVPIRLYAGIAAAVGLAAALLLVFRRPESEGIGLKGAGMSVQRNREGQVQAIGEGDTIRAGDGLRVVVTLSRAAIVEVWFVDADGRRDPFVDGASLPAGETALPASARVDSPCRDLTVHLRAGEPEVVSHLRCE